MRRLFWMGVGATVAVLVVQEARQLWHRYSPEGVAEQVEQAGQGVIAAGRSAMTTFVESFRTRERDLTAQLLATPEAGDARAVFGRGRGPERGPETPTDPAAERARPEGRVDPDEPLYDF